MSILSKLKKVSLLAFKVLILLYVCLAALKIFGGSFFELAFGPHSEDTSQEKAKELVLRYTQNCSDGRDPRAVTASGPTGDYGTWVEALIEPDQFECFKEKSSLVPCKRGCDPEADSIVSRPEWFLVEGKAFTFIANDRNGACFWKKKGSIDRYVFSRLSTNGCTEY